MYIETIGQMTTDEWRKSFYLGRYLYDYETKGNSRGLFRRTQVLRTKNHINSIISRYDLNVPEQIDFKPSDILDPLISYNINYQSVAWTGYFTYSILLSLRDSEDRQELHDNWIKILSYSMDGNPGYSSAFYDGIEKAYDESGPRVRECFRKIMKDSYYDTYGLDYDETSKSESKKSKK